MDVLNGKRCFITGATGGLGREIALEMAISGCHLFLTSRHEDWLAELANQCRAHCQEQRQVHYSAGDLARIADLETVVGETRHKLGDIDILINCAGIFPVKSLTESTVEDFDECFNLNVKAPFLLARAFVPDMRVRGWGRIVNIGSSSAYIGVENTSVYCATKHAVLGLSRSWANEFREEGIRTYCVSPGSIKTPMGRQVPSQDYSTFIDPKEIAKYISFIISLDENLITEEVRLNRVLVR